MSALSIEELEVKMRPGQSSVKGFLGLNESLEQVISQDEETLIKFGVYHNQIADQIEKIVKEVRKQKELLPWDQRTSRDANFPLLHRPETIPAFSEQNLPSTKHGYLVSNLQVFLVQYRGYQECPWGCKNERGSCDLMVFNRSNGNWFTAPELIIHLIRTHHFFEGVESPYRADPEKIILTLEIG